VLFVFWCCVALFIDPVTDQVRFLYILGSHMGLGPVVSGRSGEICGRHAVHQWCLFGRKNHDQRRLFDPRGVQRSGVQFVRQQCLLRQWHGVGWSIVPMGTLVYVGVWVGLGVHD
jgi:hypothetical protein